MKKSKKKKASKTRKAPKPQVARVQKLLVITEAGRVVGTQAFAEPTSRPARVTATLQAGPGQQAHELEIEVPARLGPEEIHAFHALIAERLQIGK
ncbi:MAG: hypothetical protein ACJ8KA_02815 [Sulfurifustis sp.]